MAIVESKRFEGKGLSFIIRSARIEDAEQLLELIPKLDSETPFMLREPGEFNMTLEQEREFIKSKQDSERDLLLVAEVDGEIVGTLGFSGNTLRRYRHSGQFGMAVLKKYWGRGIGSALLGMLLEWTDSKGFLRVSLQVYATNSSAIRLYKKFGFEEEGRLRKDCIISSGEFVDTIVMARVK